MLSGLIKFVAGSAVGGAVGVAIGALMAPKSGAETQADAAALIQGAKAEGQRAQQAAEAVRGGHVGAGRVERDARAARHLLARRRKLMQTVAAYATVRGNAPHDSYDLNRQSSPEEM